MKAIPAILSTVVSFAIAHSALASSYHQLKSKHYSGGHNYPSSKKFCSYKPHVYNDINSGKVPCGKRLNDGTAKIKRGEFGLFTVHGGKNDFDVYRAAGRAVAQDRLAQIVLTVEAANGRSAALLGEGSLSADIFTRRVIYPDSNLQAQFITWSPRTRALLAGYIQGINDHIRDVRKGKAPLPAEFVEGKGKLAPINLKHYKVDVTDALKDMYRLTYNFTSTFFTSGQDSILGDTFSLSQLGYDATDAAAYNIDIRSSFSNLARYSTSCGDISLQTGADPNCPQLTLAGLDRRMMAVEQRAIGSLVRPLELERDRLIANPSWASKLPQEHKLKKAIALLNSHGVPTKMGSYGVSVHGSKTKSGNPMFVGAPQAGNNSVPAVGSIIHVKNRHYENQLTVFPLTGPVVNLNYITKNAGYVITGSGQVSTAPGFDAVYDFLGSPNLIALPDAVIEVDGTVESVPNSCTAVDNGGTTTVTCAVVQTNVGSVGGEPTGNVTRFGFPGGFDTLVRANRNALNFGAELSNFSIELLFAKSLAELQQALAQNDNFLALNNNFITSDGNIGVTELARSFDLPNEDKIFGQDNSGLLVGSGLITPPPPSSDYVVNALPFVTNPPVGYYAGWNQRWFPNQDGTVQFSSATGYARVGALHDFIGKILDERKMKFKDLKKLMIHAGRQRDRSTTGTSQNYFSNPFPWLFADRLIGALPDGVLCPQNENNNVVTKADIVNFFDDYDGRYFTAVNRKDILKGDDVDPRAVLSGSWLAVLQSQEFFVPFIPNSIGEDFFLVFWNLADQEPTVEDPLGVDISTGYHGIFASVIGAGPDLGNPINFPDFVDQLPAGANEYTDGKILDGLCYALNLRPDVAPALDPTQLADLPGWGAGQRDTVDYVNNNLIPEQTAVADAPIMNRASVFLRTELSSQGVKKCEIAIPVGISGLVTVNKKGDFVFDKNYTSMDKAYRSFKLVPCPILNSRSGHGHHHY